MSVQAPVVVRYFYLWLHARRSFDTKDGEWQDIVLPFSEFIPTFRAKTLRDGSKLNPASVCSVQLMLSKFEYDGELNPHFKAGPMQLPIEAIRAHLKEPVTPRWVGLGRGTGTGTGAT
jgi:hypothetical protein